jgi:predicted regulator of amino acid metabolism with ACT domain
MQTKQKVLHFIESAGVYGAERVILNLSLEMQKAGNYTPVVGCIVDSVSSESALYDAALAAGVEAIKIPISNARLLTDLPKAASLIAEQHIAIIHSHGYKPSVEKNPCNCHLSFMV